jgi:hypothetical protein
VEVPTLPDGKDQGADAFHRSKVLIGRQHGGTRMHGASRDPDIVRWQRRARSAQVDQNLPIEPRDIALDRNLLHHRMSQEPPQLGRISVAVSPLQEADP